MQHRKSTTQFLFLAVFLLFGFTTMANNYYLSSSSGNDNNSGTDPSSPWQSLNKLNSFRNFSPGDNIYFKRGDTFYGSITINNSGTSGSPITYEAYGSGNKPIISGFTSVNAWTGTGGNIWQSNNAVSNLSSANVVLVNGLNTAMGRYPNNGWNKIASSTGTSIVDGLLSGINWTGADLVVRKDRWIIDRMKINSQAGSSVNFSSMSSNPQNGWGYFIENSLKTLDAQNEWYFDPVTKKVSIYSGSYPTNVQVSSVDVLISMYGKNYITFDNLALQGGNTNIFLIASSKYITIQNCNLSFCGDEAINGQNWQAGNYSDFLTVKNNSFSDNANKDIDLQNYFDNAYIGYNTFKRTGMIIGGAQNEPFVVSIKTTASNTKIEYNSIDSVGYSGIDFSGNNTIIQNNLISNFCLLRDDGGAIYTFSDGNKYTGQKILNNIILNGIGNSDGTPKLYDGAVYADGIYLDENTVNVEIGNNTIANCSYAGIFLHNSSNNNVHDNTSYNNSNYQILIQSDNNNTANNSFTGNIFFSKMQNQQTGSYKGIKNDISNFGTFDNNYYARPIDDSETIQTVENNWATVNQRTLAQWQTVYGKDLDSKKSPKVITDVKDLRFEYNSTASSTTISLDAKYIDVRGNVLDGSITLAPYTSAVLIKDGPSTGGNLLPAVFPSNPVNGLDYKYYEASNYTALPSFSSVTPVKTGSVDNFDLSPANNLNNFSFNFTGYIDVPTDGQYTFYTTSDDGSNLLIDGVAVVNNDGLHGSTEQSGTIGLKAGKHAISVGYFQQAGDKSLSVSYAGPGIGKQQIPAPSLYRSSVSSNLLSAIDPSNIVNGLDYKYYEASNYTALPSFSSVTPVKTGNVDNFDLSPAYSANNFSFNFTGYIVVPTDGQYIFYTTSDDGSNLIIDGVTVVNNDGLHSATEQSGTIGLKAGKHAISVGFFQQGGDKSLSVSFAGPGIGKQEIPAADLYRPADNGNLLPAVYPLNPVNGLDYKYYEASNYTALPDFSSVSPVKTGTANNFDISVANRTSTFSFDFGGYIDVPSDGQYTFYSGSDDGSNLYIDNILVVNNDGLHSLTEKSGTIGLQAGKHLIRVEYFQQYLDHILNVSYAGPGVPKQLIPASVLYRGSTSILEKTMITSGTASESARETIGLQPNNNFPNNLQDGPGMKVFPNPFRNSIQINVNNLQNSKFKLVLMTASGQIVWSKEVENYNFSFHESVNTSNLPIGMYFLNLMQDNKTTTYKLIKQY